MDENLGKHVEDVRQINLTFLMAVRALAGEDVSAACHLYGIPLDVAVIIKNMAITKLQRVANQCNQSLITLRLGGVAWKTIAEADDALDSLVPLLSNAVLTAR